MHAHFPTRHLALVSTLSLAASIAGCSADSSTTPDTTPGAVTFSVASSSAATPAASRSPLSPSRTVIASGTSLIIALGSDTLQLDTVNVVFARVRLRKLNDTACGDDGHDDAADQNCAVLKEGPILVSLPLTAGAKTVFGVPAPSGTYTGIALWTHRPKRADSGPNQQEFLAAHPDYEGTSIRVFGKFNGVAFTWRGDPEVKIEQAFVPPLTVSDVSGLQLTLKIDLASWFASSTNTLLDPRTTSYPQIALNIKNSFKAFEDKQHNGHDDHEGGTH
jgi:hypothetical protein